MLTSYFWYLAIIGTLIDVRVIIIIALCCVIECNIVNSFVASVENMTYRS